jgi:hypothetical protein
MSINVLSRVWMISTHDCEDGDEEWEEIEK